MYQLQSASDNDLEELFIENPKARTLNEWSPFVVIVDNDRAVWYLRSKILSKWTILSL